MNAPFEKPFMRRGKSRARQRETPPYRRKILFEALEPRLLLSADGASPAVADLLAAALVQADQPQSSTQLVAPEASPAPVLITISPDTSVDTDVTASTWIIETESGERALQAGDSDNVWRITGNDEGTLNGVPFTDVGILLGGADNQDTFYVEPGGSLSGYLDGGRGGFDTLVVNGSFNSLVFTPTGPDSGTVDSDGDLITYAGLEPVSAGTASNVTFNGTVGADDWVIEDSPTPGHIQVRSTSGAIETTSFANPAALTLNLGAGIDSLTLDSLGDSGFSGRILVNGQGDNDTLNLVADLTLVRFTDGSALATDGQLAARFVDFQAFNGGNGTITEHGLPQWLSEGPSRITGGQVQLPAQNNPVIGAVNQVATNPFDPNVLFAATVGGGVWRNSDRTVFFDTGASAVNADSMLVLNGYANFLKANPTLVVHVNGYTDNTPNLNPGGNPQLSLDRANAVRDYLVNNQHVDAGQLVVAGLGEANPLAPNDTPAHLALNRRVELIANHWTPLTDAFASLAIGSLALSSRDSIGNPLTATTPSDNLVLYAGTGQFSSNREGGAAIGLLKSTDGGTTWSLLAADPFAGLRITSVVATGLDSGGDEIVLVSALSSATNTGGIFRSTDGGQIFTRLVAGDATDLVADPGDPDRFYAALLGTGVMVSDGTDGATWTATATQPSNGGGNGANADRIRLSVQADAGNANNAVFAELELGSNVTGVFRSTNQGGVWAQFGPVPVTGGAADLFMSLQASADGTHAFIGGASSGAGMGNLFLSDGGAWNAVVGASAGNTAPHADSHRLALDMAGRLIDTDDGGIYRLSLPLTGARAWSSVNDDLTNSEVLSLAYDPLNNVLLVGNQDTGSSQQLNQPPDPVDLDGDGLADDFATRGVWSQILQADGQGQLAVPIDATHMLRFSMSNNFRFFVANQFDNTGAFVSGGTVGLRNAPAAADRSGLEAADRVIANSGAFQTIPYVVNAVASASNRMLIGFFSLYESTDRLTTITPRFSSAVTAAVNPNFLPADGTAYTALAYGGRKDGNDKPDIIYAARGSSLFVRVDGAAANAFTDVSIAGSGQIISIAMDPEDWETVYATDGTTVWKSTTHGDGHHWDVVSQNLHPPGGAIKTLEVLNTGIDTVLLAGTSANVYRAIDPAPNVAWTQAGLGLPNSPVRAVHFFDRGASPDALFAGTQGRGAWAIYGDVASQLDTPSTLHLDGTSAADTFTIARDADNPALVDISLNSVSPVLQVPLAAIQGLMIHTGGGADHLVIDSSHGALSFADGISFDGDAGTTVELDGGSMLEHSSTTSAGTTTFTARLAPDGDTERVSFGENAAFTNNLTSAGDDVVNGAGLGDFIEWLDQVAQLPTSGGGATQPDLALLGTSLFSAIMGMQRTGQAAEADAPVASPDDADAEITGLRRLFETGTGAFDIGSIGTGITTFAQLKTALEGLGGTVTGSDLSDVQFHLVKDLDGEAALDGDFSFGGGQVTLSGEFDLEAEVELNLRFGVDGSGFFIDTATSNLSVDHITLNGAGHADGRFGFLDVAADIDTLTVDPAVGVSVSLSAAGDKLRLSDLDGGLGSHVAVSANGAHTSDVSP